MITAILASNKGFAQEIQDMFLYQTNGDSLQNDFIRSNVEGLFEGQKFSKKISDQFAFELVHLQTMHKELDSSHRNTLERNTIIDVDFAGQFFSRIQLGNTRQDIDTYNETFSFNNESQKMYSLSQGWKGDLATLTGEGYVGVVQCSNSEAQRYYPVFGLKIGKAFANNSEIQLNFAQEVLGGGSYTGIYGNQIFRKMTFMSKISLLEKLSLLWGAGIGISKTSYEEKGTSTGVATASIELEYNLGAHVKGSVGYSHRKLVDIQTGLGNAEGHMMNASLSIVNF